jgi:hypothetical protein
MISDEETVLTRGSNGPRPSKLLNQQIAPPNVDRLDVAGGHNPGLSEPGN